MSSSFDRFTKEFGGAYYPPDPKKEPLFEGLVAPIERGRKRALGRIRALCPWANSYRLEAGWIFNGEFNAVAGIEDGIDCIGINLGVLHIIRDLFHRMMSHPDVLPHIGNNKIEEYRGIYNAERMDFDLLAIGKVGMELPPKDEARAKYSANLFWAAFYFIFQHEFGHLFNGHVDWLSKTTGFKAIGEIGASSIEGLSSIDLQTLEMDADSFALEDVLISTLRMQFDPSDRRKSPTISEQTALGSRRDTIFAVMFAILYLEYLQETK